MHHAKISLGIYDMKKIVMLSCLLSPFSFASQTLFNPIVSSTSTSSSVSNPASDYLTAQQNVSGLVLIEPLALGYELGQVDSLIDELDELEDILENGVSSSAEATAAEAKFNSFLENAGEEGYVKAIASGSVIVFPSLYQNARAGVFTLNFNYGGMAKLSVLDDPNGVTVTTSGSTSSTESSVYEQVIKVSTFGLGYRETLWTNGVSSFSVGTKFNLTQLYSSRKLSTIEYQGDDEDEGEYTSTNIGIDVGVLWKINALSLGLTATNLNEPTYNLGELGYDCSNGRSSTGETNCEASVSFDSIGDIDLNGEYVAERQVTADFVLSSAENALNIQGSYDLNSVTDATGDEYQWAEIAFSYLSDSFFIPGLRVGYKQNLVGNELSYVNAGYTFFKYINIDSGMSLDTVSYEGATYPRSLYINLGLAAVF